MRMFKHYNLQLQQVSESLRLVTNPCKSKPIRPIHTRFTPAVQGFGGRCGI